MRSAVFLLTLAVALTGAPAVSADQPSRPIERDITLSMPDQGMAAVPVEFAVSATPAKGLENLTAALQVRTGQGFTTVRKVKLDRRGKARGAIVSNRPGTKEYRTALLSAKGRVVAASAPVAVTWAPLRHTLELDCEASSAPIDIDIPCTITVTPAVRLDRMIASLQVMGATEWVPVEAVRVPTDGVIETHVTGIEPGTGMYRAVLIRDARVLAESATVSIAYSAP